MISRQKKRVNSDIFKNTGNTGHFCKNTGFYRTSKKYRTLQEIQDSYEDCISTHTDSHVTMDSHVENKGSWAFTVNCYRYG